MRVVLISMVRNEERILRRCLDSVVGVVDAFCIHDTGSTDKTCDIAKEFLTTHPGSFGTSTWKNFGYNRTQSFIQARAFVLQSGWNPAETFGLLLDADMVFHPGSLRKQALTEKGYSVLQCAGNLQYPNCRLVRFDHEWVCRGVTHEYWDGPTGNLPKSICFIEDRNDGGCKSDKFERDARLLEQGLKDEPRNVRYMFYLAQTYHSLGRWKDAIKMYKKRVGAGGWFEEAWYSLYMIGQCWLQLKTPIKFEEYMLKAYEMRPGRAESLYKLAKHFREVGQHYKAYQYVMLGIHTPLSTDSLFVERDVYTGLFFYEKSILDYYVKSDTREGVRSSMQYLMKSADLGQSVLSNLHFYIAPVSANVKALATPQPFGPEFHSSAVSIVEYPYANVRYVNYWIEGNEYKTPRNEPVQTHNAYVNLDTMEVVHTMDEDTVGLPKTEHRVRGLEDVRVMGNEFTATVYEYGSGVRVMKGTYNRDGTYADCAVMASPFQRECEKNWLLMEGTTNIIYDWSPLHILNTKGEIVTTHETPPWFFLLRGSAPAKLYKGRLWALAHFVEYTNPRKYYHCFVTLQPDTYKPVSVSLPFVFKSPGVEYCVSFTITESGTIDCYVSFQDQASSVVTFSEDDLEFLSI
jgi:glycosyltransferase involved in cell wall biosynthesis